MTSPFTTQCSVGLTQFPQAGASDQGSGSCMKQSVHSQSRIKVSPRGYLPSGNGHERVKHTKEILSPGATLRRYLCERGRSLGFRRGNPTSVSLDEDTLLLEVNRFLVLRTKEASLGSWIRPCCVSPSDSQNKQSRCQLIPTLKIRNVLRTAGCRKDPTDFGGMAEAFNFSN